ncbi:MAG: hypothetical protein ACWGO1_04815, partial [Anaerolineales bacterium]
IEFDDPLQALSSMDDEIYYLPEYYSWDYETPTTVGCPLGGSLSFELVDGGEAFTLQECAFSDGFVMTGEGFYYHADGMFTLTISVSGLADGRLTYLRDADWNQRVAGEYAGQAVDLSQ